MHHYYVQILQRISSLFAILQQDFTRRYTELFISYEKGFVRLIIITRWDGIWIIIGKILIEKKWRRTIVWSERSKKMCRQISEGKLRRLTVGIVVLKNSTTFFDFFHEFFQSEFNCCFYNEKKIICKWDNRLMSWPSASLSFSSRIFFFLSSFSSSDEPPDR